MLFRSRKATVTANKTTATKAKTKPHVVPSFDLSGVGQYFTVASHLETFRKLVLSEPVSKYLQYDQQAKVAQALVELFKEQSAAGKLRHAAELTSDFIKRELELLLAAPRMITQLVKKAEQRRAQEELQRSSWIRRWESASQELARFTSGAVNIAVTLRKLARERPPEVEVTKNPNLRAAQTNVSTVKDILDGFDKVEQGVIEGQAIRIA